LAVKEDRNLRPTQSTLPEAAGFRVTGVIQHPTLGDLAPRPGDLRSPFYRALSRTASDNLEDGFEAGYKGKGCASNSGSVQNSAGSRHLPPSLLQHCHPHLLQPLLPVYARTSPALLAYQAYNLYARPSPAPLAYRAYNLHHIHSRLFPLSYTIMGRKDVPAEELLKRAKANGYKQGAHQVEDSIRDNTKYVKKTLKDQNWALGRYEKWVQT